jgi:uncharacterized protein CbrC (UPF0167 family)
VATFRYFAEPHAFSTYTIEPAVCASCQRQLPGYRGPFYGLGEFSFVCEECLASGALLKFGQSTNEGDVIALRQQLATLRRDLPESERDRLLKERTDELAHRTPHLVTWQDWDWPAHCGDYCRFLKEAGKLDLERIAAPGDAKSFLARNLRDGHETDLDYLWQCIRPDSPKDGRVAYDVGLWLFQCLTCAEYVLVWDAS